jgi:hypothetical protein
MRRFLAILVVLAVIFGIYWFVFRSKKHGPSGPKMAPVALKKHSEPFNNSINKLMTAYLDMKNAFVDDDTTKAKQHAVLFINLLDSIPLTELKKDTAGIFETAQSNLNDIKANAQSLLTQVSITEMRKDFSMVTEMMYPSFFETINYEGPNLYLENCATAFGEDQAANWISNSYEIVNPYLGKNHPQYKTCGEVKDTIKAN